MMSNNSKNEKEARRLEALAAYNILDTPPEKEFDNITRLACILCETPRAFISFFSEDKQYFKSTQGFSLKALKRRPSICEKLLKAPYTPIIISDIRIDKRFSKPRQLATDPSDIFYAGICLVTDDGVSVGTLCVVDSVSRNLSSTQLEGFKYLGLQVMQLLELRKSDELLQRSNQRLVNVWEQMESFAYTASHDLKEPARMVNGFLGQLKNKYEQHLDEKARTYIGFALDNARRMTRLIDDLLIYSRLDDVRKVHEIVQMDIIVNNILTLKSAMINRTGTVVQFKGLPAITAGRSGVKTVFTQLITNAIHFASPDIPPRIEIKATDRNSYWEFSVNDNGIGIAPEHRKIVFGLLSRIKPKPEDEETGMGLPICKKIISGYNGKIWIEANHPQGSSFYFTISKNY